MPSLFGWLENIPYWRNLPYPVKGALLRALKAAASVIVGILVAAATEGLLFPMGTSPVIILVVTMVLQSVDKFLRETELAKEQGAVVDPPDAPVDTDATVPQP